jgi:hypothetical protein
MLKRVIFLALTAAMAMQAQAADATLKGLVQQAKGNADGKVRVMHERGEDVSGTLTDVGGDVFCVAVPLPEKGRNLEYCYPYAIIRRVVKPNTGAHNDFNGIWVAGGR